MLFLILKQRSDCLHYTILSSCVASEAPESQCDETFNKGSVCILCAADNSPKPSAHSEMSGPSAGRFVFFIHLLFSAKCQLFSWKIAIGKENSLSF